ncbi:hypothetical protein CSA37_06430 [Candidatus Fermentibacteria bacterium]|nr:MAG: hypothetical protein CSA37_06430 [Candidatus Fermentibacteria bacterium]
MKKFAMLLAMLLVLFAFGCGEQGGHPAPAGEGGEAGEAADSGDNGSGGEEGRSGDVSIEYMDPAVGQWIAYGVEGEEAEAVFSIVAEEEGCLWYQIEFDGEAVAQVLIDPEILGQLTEMGSGYIDEFMADPVAYMEEYMPENGNIMENEEYLENMILFLTAVKKIKVNDGTQLMLLDMAGVPELVEEMIAENPDFLDESMDPEQGAEMEEMMAELEQAEFSVDQVDIDGVDCTVFTASHPEEGTITVAISDELPIVPLMEARVEPLDAQEEGGAVMVTGWGFEGAENLMTDEPDQVIPLAMMLQGFAAQFEGAAAE